MTEFDRIVAALRGERDVDDVTFDAPAPAARSYVIARTLRKPRPPWTCRGAFTGDLAAAHRLMRALARIPSLEICLVDGGALTTAEIATYEAQLAAAIAIDLGPRRETDDIRRNRARGWIA